MLQLSYKVGFGEESLVFEIEIRERRDTEEIHYFWHKMNFSTAIMECKMKYQHIPLGTQQLVCKGHHDEDCHPPPGLPHVILLQLPQLHICNYFLLPKHFWLPPLALGTLSTAKTNSMKDSNNVAACYGSNPSDLQLTNIGMNEK